jgi:hypothetical protein
MSPPGLRSVRRAASAVLHDMAGARHGASPPSPVGGVPLTYIRIVAACRIAWGRTRWCVCNLAFSIFFVHDLPVVWLGFELVMRKERGVNTDKHVQISSHPHPPLGLSLSLTYIYIHTHKIYTHTQDESAYTFHPYTHSHANTTGLPRASYSSFAPLSTAARRLVSMPYATSTVVSPASISIPPQRIVARLRGGAGDAQPGDGGNGRSASARLRADEIAARQLQLAEIDPQLPRLRPLLNPGERHADAPHHRT